MKRTYIQELLTSLCVIAVTLQCLCAAVVAVTNQPLRIISIVSSSSGMNIPLWGRGEELIPGALLAAEQININEDILNGFHIEVVPLFVQDCSVSEGILKTVQEFLSSDNPVIGVLGLFCYRLMEALSPLLSKIGVIQLSGAAIMDSVESSDQIMSIVPAVETKMQVLIEFLQALNWRRFNLVSIRSKTPLENYYTKVAETLVDSVMMNSNYPFEIVLKVELQNSIESLIQQLSLSTTSIIVAVLPPETAADLLCHAFIKKMTWPRYGWIMLDLTVNESAQCGGESLLRAMENVIVLQTKFKRNNFSNLTNINYIHKLCITSNCKHNPYATTLYDSVWALALAVNSSLQALNLTLAAKSVFGTLSNTEIQKIKENLLTTTFTNVFGKGCKCSHEICQIQNELFILLGEQSLHDNLSMFQLELLDEMRPQNEIPRYYRFLPVGLNISLLIGICLCVLLVTVILVLFLCYWRHPEVRASSRALSLCIFLGCYLFLASALGNSIVVEASDIPVCVVIMGSFTIGVDLILATVLAKIIRIAYIFNNYKKIGNECSDITLLVMIAIIILGKIILLVIWNGMDYYHIVDSPELITDHNGLPVYSVTQTCYSQHTTVWLLLVLAYTVAICIPLPVLTYRTRKIEHGHYKDTKKINGFLFFLLFGSALVPLWGIFRNVGWYEASIFASSTGYTIIPVMCQVFLIIPKIAPGLKKSLKLRHQFLSETACSSNN